MIFIENVITNQLPRLEDLGSITYWIIFFVSAAESLPFVGIILPGSLILAGIGFFAVDGDLRLPTLIVVASLGAVLGDSIGYYLGKYKARKLFTAESKFFNHRYVEKTEKYFQKHGGKSVFIGRFVGILRPFISVVAGIHGMNYFSFFLYNIIGGIIWSAFYILIGFYFSEKTKAIFTFIDKIGYKIIISVAIIGTAAWLWRKIHAKAQQGDL